MSGNLYKAFIMVKENIAYYIYKVHPKNGYTNTACCSECLVIPNVRYSESFVIPKIKFG